MYRLYEKSKLWFALIWIILYVVGASVADNLTIGVPKLATLVFIVLLIAVLGIFLRRYGLREQYGFCSMKTHAVKFLYFIPLVVLSTVNLWFGVVWQAPLAETLCFAGSMIGVAVLEELLFRGLLFRAMQENSPKTAVLISSLTFGIGHIVNLVNGSGAGMLPTLLQICEATAFGYLFVVIFCKGRSLAPCIIAHAVLNVSSFFADTRTATPLRDGIVAFVVCVVAAGYAVWLQKNISEQ